MQASKPAYVWRSTMDKKLIAYYVGKFIQYDCGTVLDILEQELWLMRVGATHDIRSGAWHVTVACFAVLPALERVVEAELAEECEEYYSWLDSQLHKECW
jgi:hypothetical protein